MLSEKVLQVIRSESIKNYGVHSVAEWESGGSDAVTQCIHTKTDFRKEYPQAKTEDITDFFDGKRDGFVVDRQPDSKRDGEMITYRVYYCVQETPDGEVTIFDNDGEIVISRFTEVDIDTRIANWLNVDELQKLLKGLARILSSLDIGEDAAWKLLCHIETKAIDALKAKSEPSEIPEPDAEPPDVDGFPYTDAVDDQDGASELPPLVTEIRDY